MIAGKSGSFEISGNPFSGRITWSETYDIDKNVSILSIDSIEAKSSSWYGFGYYPSGSVSVDGIKVGTMSSGSGTHYVTLTKKDTYYAIEESGEKPFTPWVSGEITHEDDGTKSVVISVSIGLYTTSGNGGSGNKFTGSVTIDLTDIPRASSITSAGNITLGNSCSVMWTPLSASFRYKLKFALGGWSYTTDVIHPNTTAPYTFTGYVIPLEVANQITDGPNKSMTVSLCTYSDSEGAVQIGEEDTVGFTATVPDNEDTKPDVSMNLSLVTDLAYPFNDLYIQNLTKVAADISAAGKYGAGIEVCQMVIGGGAYGDPYVSGYLTRTGEVTVTGQAVDSRGYVGKVDKSIYVIPYSKPALVPADGETGIVCVRCDEHGNLTDSGTWLKIKAKRSYSPVVSDGEQHNFCEIRYRCNGGEWDTILHGYDGGDEVEVYIPGVVISTTTAYTIEVGVIDDLGFEASAHIIVPSDQVEFHLREGGDGAAFGEYAQEAKVLVVAESWELKAKGNVTIGGVLKLLGAMASDIPMGGNRITGLPEPVSDNEATPKSYVDEKVENISMEVEAPLSKKDGKIGLTMDTEVTEGSTNPVTSGAVYAFAKQDDPYQKLSVAAGTNVAVSIKEGEMYALFYITSYKSNGDLYLKVNGAAPDAGSYAFSGNSGKYDGGIITYSGTSAYATFSGFAQLMDGVLSVWGMGLRGNGTGFGWANAIWNVSEVQSMAFTRAGVLSIRKL